MRTSGKALDVAGVTRGFDEGVDIPHVAALVAFAEAIVLRDAPRSAAARAELLAALGVAGLVDACAIVAAFHGFVRIADATGIPYTAAAQGRDAPDIRERAGVNDFYRVRGETPTSSPGPRRS
jgi:hypothetical protein